MTAPKSKRKRNPEGTRRNVIRAYADGKTFEEAAAWLDKKNLQPSRRQHMTIRKQLVEDGLLQRLETKPMKWIPSDQVISNRIAPASNPVINTDEYETGAISNTLANDAISTVVIEKVKNDCLNAIKEIDHDFAWKNIRRIRAISKNYINPIVHDIGYLRSKNLQFTMPWDFFKSENPPIFKGLTGWKDLRGPIGIPGPGTKFEWDEDGNLMIKPDNSNSQVKGLDHGMIFPSLPEWREYLLVILSEIEHIQRDLH